jgi:ubiquitin-conjugating enzyme E2 variant
MLVTSTPFLPTRPAAAGSRLRGHDAATVELEDKPVQADTHYADGTPRSDLSTSAQLRCGSPPTSALGKVVAGVMLGGGLWTAANIASQVASAGPAGVALAAGALVGGYAAADLASGIFHHWVDNYPTAQTPVVGKMAREFQEHHFRTYDLLEFSLLDNCVNAGRFLAPVMAAVAATNPHYTVAAGALAFLSGGYLAQGSHRWSHMQNPPRIGKLMQNLGLAQSKKNHATHHRMPWADYYCIVNGMWNPLLSRTDFWRKLEKVYYQATGAEPKSWRDQGVRELALGQISRAEFLQGQDVNRKAFAERIRDERSFWRSQDQVRQGELDRRG